MTWHRSAGKWSLLRTGIAVGWMLWAGAGFATANQSASLTPSTTLPFSIPSTAPFTNLGATRIEMRLHDYVPSTAVGLVLVTAGIQVRLRTTGEICASNFMDSLPGAGGEMCADVNGHPDVTIRIQRDIAAKLFRYDVWSTTGDWTATTYCGFEQNGTNGNTFPCAISTVNQNSWIGAGWVGDQSGFRNTQIKVAWIKWFSTLAPDNHIPTEFTSADLVDWRFEGNLNDTGPFHIRLGSSASFAPTPVYAPGCKAGTPSTLRAGFAIQLDGTGSYPLDGNPTLSYLWQQLRGPSTAVWDNHTAVSPNLQGLIFGTYSFQLTVTDQSGQSSSCTVRDGLVSTDSNGVVAFANPLINTMAGSSVREGFSPWPWFEDRNRAAANAQINNLNTYYLPWWRTFQPGTITLTAGSATITGQGAALRALCNGGTAPRNGAFIVWRYTGTDSLTHYASRSIAGCADDTHVTMTAPYPTTPWNALPDCSMGCGGLSFTYLWDGDTGGSVWGYSPAPANYYDNVAGFYTLYYRTGITDYLTSARLLADEWWEHPSIDQGTGCNLLQANYDSCWQRRQIAVLGLVMRALDGRPDMWPGLRIIWDRFRYYISNYFVTNGVLDDIREDAYVLAMVAECGLVEPDPSQKQQCQDTLVNSTGPVWSKYQGADGGWEAFYSGGPTSITSLAGSGSVSVTHNSATVTGVGTNWTAAQFASGYLWIFNPPAALQPPSNAQGDPAYYTVTFVNPTTLTLDRPYEGRTGTDKGYVFGTGNFVGWGAQPFMEGLLATAFSMAASALDGYNNTARDLFHHYTADAVQWIRTYGINRDSTGGAFTGAQFPGCIPPIPSTDRMCYPAGATPSQNRTLAAELMRALGAAYAHSPSADLKADGDRLMSQMFSKPGTGGPNPDGFYVSDWDDVTGTYLTGTPPLGIAPKWFGEFFGFSNTGDWAAQRAGGPVPPQLHPLDITFDLSLLPEAQQVMVTITDPSGAVSQTSCSSSPCTIQVDTRLGNPLISLQYLSSGGLVVASGQSFVASVL